MNAIPAVDLNSDDGLKHRVRSLPERVGKGRRNRMPEVLVQAVSDNCVEGEDIDLIAGSIAINLNGVTILDDDGDDCDDFDWRAVLAAVNADETIVN